MTLTWRTSFEKLVRLVGLVAALAVDTARRDALAGEVEILKAVALKKGAAWTVSVTLRHDDEGWDHYADLWQVLAPDGKLLGERVLAHPHVDEQPFTRSLGNLSIPEELSTVFIRARDSRHGFAGQLYRLDLRR